MIDFTFVFGHEPWLLPAALEMVKVLKNQGLAVHVLYYGKNPVSGDLPEVDVLTIIPEDLSKKGKFTKEWKLKKTLNNTQSKYYIANDLISAFALSWSKVSDEKCIFWAFEVYLPLKKFKPSLDYFRLKYLGKATQDFKIILIPSEERKILYHQTFGKSLEDIVVLYNTKSTLNKPLTIDKKYAEVITADKVNVLYAGRFSPSQFADQIIASSHFLPDGYQWVICGVYDESYKSQIDNTPKMIGLGRLDIESLSSVSQLCQIGICFYDKSLLIDNEIPAPNKIGDYLSLGLKILTTDQKYLVDIVEKNHLGKSISTISPENIANAIVEVSENNNYKSKDLIIEHFLHHFNMNKEVDKLLHYLQIDLQESLGSDKKILFNNENYHFGDIF